MADNSRAINRVFTRSVIGDLIQNGSNEVFDVVVRDYKLLRKQEYESIIFQIFKELPKVAPVFHFKACLEMFKQIPILKAQDMTFKELKKRNRISKTDFENIQPELKSTIYFSELSRKLSNLEQLLKTTYRGEFNVFSIFQR